MSSRPAVASRKGSFLLARVWHVVWGFPQTLVGLVLFLAFFRWRRHYAYRSAVVTEWSLRSGLSLGMFIFVPRNCSQALLAHEYGHSIQSLILGLLYLPAIVLPSLVWAGTPRLRRYRSAHAFSYYRFYTERWANLLVRWVTGATPEGWYPRRNKSRRGGIDTHHR